MSHSKKSKEDSGISFLQSENFSNLEPAIQNQIINLLKQNTDKTGGIMGKLLGIKPANLAIHAILILCLLLLFLILLDNIHAYQSGTAVNMDLINIIIPVITLAIGYIIGKGANDS